MSDSLLENWLGKCLNLYIHSRSHGQCNDFSTGNCDTLTLRTLAVDFIKPMKSGYVHSIIISVFKDTFHSTVSVKVLSIWLITFSTWKYWFAWALMGMRELIKLANEDP